MYPNIPYVPKRPLCTRTSFMYLNIPYVPKRTERPLCTQTSFMYLNVPYVPKRSSCIQTILQNVFLRMYVFILFNTYLMCTNIPYVLIFFNLWGLHKGHTGHQYLHRQLSFFFGIFGVVIA